jgi:hypothetical protein
MLILKNGDPQLLKLLSTPEYKRFIGEAYNPHGKLHDYYVHT